MDKKTLIAVGLLVVVIVVSLEWLRSGPSSDVPPEVLQRDVFIGSAGSGDMKTMSLRWSDGAHCCGAVWPCCHCRSAACAWG